jgi:hypothetical protein
MSKELDHDDVTGLLESWQGSDIEVIVRGQDSDAWLCRFGGVLRGRDGTTFEIDVGGPEAWVSPIPLSFESATLAKPDVLLIRHENGETTIRKALSA